MRVQLFAIDLGISCSTWLVNKRFVSSCRNCAWSTVVHGHILNVSSNHIEVCHDHVVMTLQGTNLYRMQIYEAVLLCLWDQGKI